MTDFFASIFGTLLGFIYDFVGNYGISIVIFTIICKLILMPLTLKQLKSTKKMTDIQPKVEALKVQYKNDPEKLNELTAKLYKDEGVNPLGGCLPLLIQMPIIIGLFAALRAPEVHVFADAATAAIAQADPFLWIGDLSSPDLMSNIFSSGPAWFLALPGLMPIISAILTYFQMKSTSSPQAGAQQNSTMKMMQYMFPVMILFWGKTFTAGLIIYWTVGNVFQLVQQEVLKRIAAKEDNK